MLGRIETKLKKVGNLGILFPFNNSEQPVSEYQNDVSMGERDILASFAKQIKAKCFNLVKLLANIKSSIFFLHFTYVQKSTR